MYSLGISFAFRPHSRLTSSAATCDSPRPPDFGGALLPSDNRGVFGPRRAASASENGTCRACRRSCRRVWPKCWARCRANPATIASPTRARRRRRSQSHRRSCAVDEICLCPAASVGSKRRTCLLSATCRRANFAAAARHTARKWCDDAGNLSIASSRADGIRAACCHRLQDDIPSPHAFFHRTCRRSRIRRPSPESANIACRRFACSFESHPQKSEYACQAGCVLAAGQTIENSRRGAGHQTLAGPIGHHLARSRPKSQIP